MASKRQARFGYIRQVISLPLSFASGTSAEEPVTDYVPGFSGTIESAVLVPTVAAAAGAGASRPLTLVRTRGTTDTTMASVTAVLADLQTKGTGKALTLSTDAGALDFVDDDKFSVALAGSGTQFTAFTGVMLLTVRSRPQQA